MKAVVIKEKGGAEQLEIKEIAKPTCKEDELLVRVKATAVNRADIAQREGAYPPPPGASPILGLELAGIVEEVGEACQDRWAVGDRVFGLLSGGGYAEYAVLPGALALPIPESLSFEEAAAIPEVFLTAYQCLFWIGRLQKGEKVLIHAGASGVGTAAIQLARATGAEALVTVGSEEKRDFCLRLGAKHAFNYREGNFSDKVLEATDGQGVDVVLDFVGAPYWQQNLSVLKMDGRLVFISALGGTKLDQASIGAILRKRLTITGTTLRSRSLAYKEALNRDFASFALPRLVSGELKPVIDTVYPLSEVQEAHRYMEQNKNKGKIVLRIED
ncbi:MULTISPECIES: NAD(P)H-quinone oxidoreductase [Laceyella]|uniref:PIG3 family NAD(P)H quinone oxidoreductase n=1 Tax=Laceyella sediminis TaxID=573074 RepID=A0ABX5ELR3_9BACL|nr:NAD(P)H-quinone oxidoreductase [Laceyella sediminis]MRG27154.1 zinc-binding dehydrogenase [Laceyella tengchongensis]PRZ12419.1 putative PIG3 family NAD(P)H quinone oxidoreductase [Laceyella sediminis]